MAFENTQEAIKNLPNWVKVGIVGVGAILAYLIIKHRSSNTTSVGTVPNGGIYNVELPPGGVGGGGGGGGSSSPTTVPPTSTPPASPAPIVGGGNPPSVPFTPPSAIVTAPPSAPITPINVTPVSAPTGINPIAYTGLNPEMAGGYGVRPSAPFTTEFAGLAPSTFGQGIQGTNSIPPYRR